MLVPAAAAGRGLARRVERCAARLTHDAEAMTGALAVFRVALVGSIALSEASSGQRAGYAGLAALCTAGCLVPRAAAWALTAATALQAARVIEAFPTTANHAFLQLALLALAALLAGPAPAERRQLLSSYRALAAAVLIAAGVQKLLHGNYFDGRMLALLIAKHERYQLVFEPLIGAAEVARLSGLDLHAAGSGPFLAGSPALIAVANATWLLELALGALLLLEPRPYAAWLGAGFIVAIELGAREIVFGFVMLALLALSLRPEAARRALLVLVALLVPAIGAAYGLLPGAGALFIEAMP